MDNVIQFKTKDQTFWELEESKGDKILMAAKILDHIDELMAQVNELREEVEILERIQEQVT